MENQMRASQPLQEEQTDMLLVIDKEKKSVHAVTGIDKDGELLTTTPTKKNQNLFMRIDKQGDLFSNFFSNFLSQLKNPTHFTFLRSPVGDLIDTLKKIKNHFNSPSSEGEALLNRCEIKTDNTQIPQKEMKTGKPALETGEYRFRPEQIDWQALSNLGVTKEHLEKRNLLDPLLKGYKTNELVPIKTRMGPVVIRTDARLSLQQTDTGQVVMNIHGIRKEPELNFAFFGHQFSQEDKDNLLKTGNMGRIVELIHPKTNEKIPSVVSVDRLTNELIAFRADRIKIPQERNGVILDEQQKQTLKEGKPLYLEGMISKKGHPFNSTLQFNADKGYVEFLFNNTPLNKIGADQTQDAINSQTKVNKANKNTKEPLTSGRRNQVSKEQQHKQEVVPPKKHKGIRR